MEVKNSISNAYEYVYNNCKYNAGIEYSFGKLDYISFNASLHMIEPRKSDCRHEKQAVSSKPC